MIFLGVEQAPQKIQFAIAKRSHFGIKTAMCRLCRGALRAPAYELKLISFLAGGKTPPLRMCAQPYCYLNGYIQSSKAWFFRLFANGKTFAPSASEVKAHDLRGLNLFQTIKSFLLLFLEKEDILYFVTIPTNQNLKSNKQKDRGISPSVNLL